MVSQVNFFMAEADEKEFVEMLRARGDTQMIAGRFHPTPTPPFVQELPPISGEQLIELVNVAITDPPVMRANGAGDFVGMYLFDAYKDAHIEWSRCYLEDGALVAGRIFAKSGWLDDRPANAAFQKWYDALARWIRRRYERTRDPWWVGPHAARWRRTGKLFSFGGGPALRE